YKGGWLKTPEKQARSAALRPLGRGHSFLLLKMGRAWFRLIHLARRVIFLEARPIFKFIESKG
ncbi:MAG: hypothetical protein C6Y22_29520, partial [Hapalosiphonaceae cyanobacterium JJU2]